MAILLATLLPYTKKWEEKNSCVVNIVHDILNDFSTDYILSWSLQRTFSMSLWWVNALAASATEPGVNWPALPPGARLEVTAISSLHVCERHITGILHILHPLPGCFVLLCLGWHVKAQHCLTNIKPETLLPNHKLKLTVKKSTCQNHSHSKWEITTLLDMNNLNTDSNLDLFIQ